MTEKRVETSLSKRERNKKNIFSSFIEWLKNEIVNILIIAGMIVLGIFLVFDVVVPWFGAKFQSASPWSAERQDIANKNNVRDAYSAIVGSDVGMISQNGIMKWFNSKEAKEIDISIPKLINYSPIFDDESNRNGLKDAFEDSINPDVMNQSAINYKIFYDGSTLGQWKNGEKVGSYKDLQPADKKSITNDLTIKVHNLKNIDFEDWEQVHKMPNVSFDFVNKSNVVKVTGVFFQKKHFWDTKYFKVNVQYKINRDKWTMVKKSLKVVQKK